MRIMAALLISLVSVFVIAAPVSADRGARTAKVRKCGNLTFSPNSEDVAWNIRTSGVSCRTARRVAARARGEWPSPSRDGATSDFRYGRFSCHGIESDRTLPQVNWTCRQRSAWIRFMKT